jgi:hypothetical protein
MQAETEKEETMNPVIRFKLSSFTDGIEKVEIVKQSPKQITYRDFGTRSPWNRTIRASRYTGKFLVKFFKTWDQAHKALLARAAQDVRTAGEILKKEQKALAKVRAMKRGQMEW